MPLDILIGVYVCTEVPLSIGIANMYVNKFPDLFKAKISQTTTDDKEINYSSNTIYAHRTHLFV